VIGRLTPEVQALLTEVIVVDNRSTDNGQELAIAALQKLGDVATRLVENDRNYGLGGSHKVAFLHALENGFDYVIVLHGDDQGDIGDLLPHLRSGGYRSVDALLGARFMRSSRLVGYSALRTFGNHIFNALYSLASRTRIYDLGSGLNMYKTSSLADRWWLTNADDLTFNYHMILRSVARKWKMRFFPLSWREEDQISNVKLVRQSIRVLSLPAAYVVGRSRYLGRDYSGRPDGGYTSRTVFEQQPAAA
jgi:glycosyltransferase involved in cell wall biosynthesis